MKLVAVFCVWGDANGMIDNCIENILPCVDGIIVVYSNRSNYGQLLSFNAIEHENTTFWNLEPGNMPPHKNETAKRNYGLNLAKKAGFTHFINLDFDEFYLRDEFMREKERIMRDNLTGLVCRIKVHFKVPTLCCEDHTLIPFIHKLGPDTASGSFKDYPFAYDAAGNAHIDPTRRLNYTSEIAMSDIYMHHMSWVRSDFEVKINNSAARDNLRRSTIYADLAAAAPGVYNNFYRKTLEECPNYFNL